MSNKIYAPFHILLGKDGQNGTQKDARRLRSDVFVHIFVPGMSFLSLQNLFL